MTIEYEDGKPIRVDAVVISAQHGPEVEYETLKNDVMQHVIKPIIPESLLDENTNITLIYWKVRYWRTPRRFRTYRQENNCGHLWWNG